MNKIPVFFNQKMVVLREQRSPSPKKPLEVVRQWKENFPVEIIDFKPLLIEQIKLAHDSVFVDKIMNCELVNGFGNRHVEVAESLPYTSGSFLAAANEAIKNGLVAVSPTSGFHHAEYAEAMGYCTFNGLMISAVNLLNSLAVKKIGILDCDHHYGNGTEDIINRLKLGDKVVHITSKKSYLQDALDFFDLLPSFLKGFKDKEIDILFYQAGADCHNEDPYGGFLTTEEMEERDRLVFSYCKNNGIPVVWNLAGGYQEERLPNGEKSIQKVLDLHNNTMKICADVFI